MTYKTSIKDFSPIKGIDINVEKMSIEYDKTYKKLHNEALEED